MASEAILRELPELRQIEAIIESGYRSHLSARVLRHIPYKNDLLPIYALTLGNQHEKDVPCITFVAGVHGLERIGTEVVITFLESLLERLNWDQTINDVLQHIRIHVLPLINPVGMLNNTRANGNGIDLMRNAPIESTEKTIWLGGGHRISPILPWYRGKSGEMMQPEAEALCDFITQEVLSAPFSLALDCHSGFGNRNQIWFPYAKSRLEPITHLREIYYLRKIFMNTYSHQNYLFEPQALHYLVHGDLWDFLYLQSLKNGNTFLPLTLEMGSWRWIRKNPMQLRKISGFYHPIKPHRLDRVLRGHITLMEFLLHATLSYQKWIDQSHAPNVQNEAYALWYPHY